MARIFFVRHGQASFLKSNYDELSSLGQTQAKLLGQFFRQRELVFDKFYCGNLVRQKQTVEGVLNGLGSSEKYGTLEGFDEHHGPEIVKPFYPDRFYLDKEVSPEDFESFRRFFYGTYFKLAIPWVKGELDPDKVGHIESWSQFKERFDLAIQQVFADIGQGENILIATSGGPVGAAVGRALQLNDENTLKLGWQVKNSSYTEFLYSKGRFNLVSFNETPHLIDPRYHTMV